MKYISTPRAVTTLTPQRLSFAGGGTDISSFYKNYGGAVLSTTIDKYIYVTVKKHSHLFKENYRLSYYDSEHVDYIDEIKNDIARECLKLVPVDPPIYISTAADLPASSGLGSSSGFAVGLLNALHVIKGESVSAGQLAEEACYVEINMLERPIGKQDQYAVAYGGLNFIQFNENDRVNIDPIWLQKNGSKLLFDNLMLFWTGYQRSSHTILSSQQSNMNKKINELIKIKDMAFSFKELMINKNELYIDQLANLLNEGWKLKKTLSNEISTSSIDSQYDRAIKAGALGGKIAGAGGGGFLLLIVPPSDQKNVRNELKDLQETPISYEPVGTRILSVVN